MIAKAAHGWGYVLALVGGLMGLNGCNIYEAAYTDQALGQQLGVGAWMDPALEPLAGCEAVFGTWSNHGNLVRDGAVSPSVLAAVIGLADDHPDAAFSAAVRLSRGPAGGMRIEAHSDGQTVAAHTVQARDLGCLSTGVMELRIGERRRLAVDRAGALWVGEHRFPMPGAVRCERVGAWTHSAPDGMATVVGGEGVLLLDPDDPSRLALVRSTALSMGVKVAPTSAFYLPGEHHLRARVHLRPSPQWQFKIPFVVIEAPTRFEACHSYLLLGGSDVGDTPEANRAWAAVVDMGSNFNWRRCTLTPDTRNIRFDGAALNVVGDCFAGGGTDRAFTVDDRRYAQ